MNLICVLTFKQGRSQENILGWARNTDGIREFYLVTKKKKKKIPPCQSLKGHNEPYLQNKFLASLFEMS